MEGKDEEMSSSKYYRCSCREESKSSSNCITSLEESQRYTTSALKFSLGVPSNLHNTEISWRGRRGSSVENPKNVYKDKDSKMLSISTKRTKCRDEYSNSLIFPSFSSSFLLIVLVASFLHVSSSTDASPSFSSGLPLQSQQQTATAPFLSSAPAAVPTSSDVPLSPPLPVSSSTTTGPSSRSPTTAYFVNGLASSLQRINSTALEVLSENDPFQLIFRTVCPFGNLVFDDKFSLTLNSKGNLTYTVTGDTSAVYHNVADGNWHAISFNGNRISLDDHDLHDHSETGIHEPDPIISWDHSDSSTTNLSFFDGFVGCIKLPSREHGSGSEAVSGEHDEVEAEETRRMMSLSGYFKFAMPYGPCNDIELDLSTIYNCHNPDEFIQCLKCQPPARCEQETPEGTGAKPMNNRCICPTDDGIEYEEPYCEVLSSSPDSTKISQINRESSETYDLNQPSSAQDSPETILPSQFPNPEPSSVSPVTHMNSSNETRPGSRFIQSNVPEQSISPSTTTSTTSTLPSIPQCPCQNGGHCAEGNGTEEPCECQQGWEGAHCEKDFDECAANPALCGRGICINQNGTYQCYCQPGFAGDNCNTDIDECLSKPCQNGATCLNEINKYTCICAPGYTGRMCQTDIDECAAEYCMNGATCIDGINSYSCECVAGFTGDNCDINIDECDSNPCLNEGSCEDQINAYHCNCDNTGFQGESCEINIDDCLSFPCQNQGNCTDGIKEHFCQCYQGYEGDDCEIDIDECELYPCLNNATCYQLSNKSLYYDTLNPQDNPRQFRKQFDITNAAGRLCSCRAGFEGVNCETDINECQSNPCINGNCVDKVNAYLCECAPGFTGRICGEEINECEPNPCERGECRDGIADYECICPSGYGGKNCSVPLTGCLSVECFNSGTCFPTYDVVKQQHNFTCECFSGFTGRGCEQKTTISFNGTGLAISTNHDEFYERGHYELTFRFRTTLPDVQLVLGKGVTYFVLTLIGGKLNLQSSLLNNLKGISSGYNLSNAAWQQVGITVNNSHIALAANSEQTIHPIQEGEDGTSSGFNTTILGGASTKLGFLNKQGLNFFIGCMQDIRINRKTIVAGLDEPNVNLSMVDTGCVRRDQCKPNPCQNGGFCTDMWQSYNCSCPRPYLGKNCEFDYTAGTFSHEESPDSIVLVDIPPEIGRKFGNTFDISMFVRTREKRGTIFFLGNNSIFIEALIDREGQLTVQAKLDDTKDEVYPADGLLISDGAPHLISIQRDKTWVTIRVNGTEHFRKSVKDVKEFNPTFMSIGGVAEITEDSTYDPAQEIPTRQVPTDENFIVTKPFKGVIQDVRVNLSSSDNGHSSAHRNNKDQFVVEFFELGIEEQYSKGEPLGKVRLHHVLDGTRSDNTCKVNPCLNGGTCEVTWNDFQCLCADGYDGKICDFQLHCAIVKCPEGSTCHNIKWSGFECVADAAFDGKGTVSPHYRLVSNERENLTLQEISFRFRTKEGGHIIYIASSTQNFKLALEIGNDEATNQSIEIVTIYINGVRHSSKINGSLDGEWHSLSLHFSSPSATDSSNFKLLFDNKDSTKITPEMVVPSNFLRDLVLQSNVQLVVGSDLGDGSHQYTVENQGHSDHHNHLESLHNSFYRGCLADLKIGDYRLPFVTQSQLLEINIDTNRSLVETTAPTAFYIDEPEEHNGSPQTHLGCILCYDNECMNGGQCDNATDVYECSCENGFEGPLCQTNIDECKDSQCEPGSPCIDGIANYTCACKPGYEGWHCDMDINECQSSPCQNGGTCENEIAKYTCHCSQDYIGQRCEKRKRSSCHEDPCEHGATCKNIEMQPDGTSFQCHCAQGYTGQTCAEEIDYCKDIICENNGSCSSIKVGFKCSCVPGFDGPRCEQDINECESNPCLNHGICRNQINAYSCECEGTGYYGPNCEYDIDECTSVDNSRNICHDDKECENLPGTYRCVCRDRNMCGDYCNITDPCYDNGNRSSSCFNEGRCFSECKSESMKTFRCDCMGGYEGKFCEQLAIRNEDSLDILLIIIPVLAAFLLAATIAIIILVRMARKKRATRGVYSPSQQEYCNPRVELDNVMKPPPEERLI